MAAIDIPDVDRLVPEGLSLAFCKLSDMRYSEANKQLYSLGSTCSYSPEDKELYLYASILYRIQCDEDNNEYLTPKQVECVVTRIKELVGSTNCMPIEESFEPDYPIPPPVVTTYYNTEASANFIKSNCPPNHTGSLVTYTVPAGTYSSTISQVVADQLAQDDIAANGQDYANLYGNCVEDEKWGNALASQSFTRDNCPPNYTGSSVTYTVPANTYWSYVSQADANAQAAADIAANGQAYANTNGTCTEDTRYYNVLMSQQFTKNNCPPNYTGTIVNYVVPANKYWSYVSQAAANQLAQDDIDANGQNYANSEGSCIEGTKYYNVAMSESFERDNCPPYHIPGSAIYSVPAGKYWSYTSQAVANQLAQDDIDANGQNYANVHGTCTPIPNNLLFRTNRASGILTFEVSTGGQSIVLEARGANGVLVDTITGSSTIKNLDLSGAVGPVTVRYIGDPALLVELKTPNIQVTDLYLAPYTEITYLWASGNLLTSVSTLTNTKLTQVLLYDNNISGHFETAHLPDLVSYEMFGNNINTISSLTNHPVLEYFNFSSNLLLTGTADFSASPNIEIILSFNTNLTSVNVVGRTLLTRLELANNPNLVQSFNFTSNPVIEIVSLTDCPVTDVTASANSTIKKFYVGGETSTIPEASIQGAIDANKLVLEEIGVTSMHTLEGPLDLDDIPNLVIVDLGDLPMCTGFSIENVTSIVSLNIAGMPLLTVMPNVGTNPLNGLLWLTGTGIGPAGVDAMLIYVSSLGIPPVSEHIVGPGAIIYGNYGSVTGSIQPTSASLAAYNDLVSRGYTIIGPVPTG